MAKEPKNNDKTKAPKEPKPAKVTITKQEDVTTSSVELKSAPELVVDKKPLDKAKAYAALVEQFAGIRQTLLSTNAAKKQPRQLRYAISTLEMAEKAANRAIKHGE